MAKKTSRFSIRESELATALEITCEQLDEIVNFFDSDPDDQWELRENYHFIYLIKNLKERLFSEEGAYAIAKYIDEKATKSIWKRITEFITKHNENIRNAFINQKIQENCTSLTFQNNLQFLSKNDVVNILCTNNARFDQAFYEIQKSDNAMIIHEDFDDIDGVRYYSLAGFYKLSRHLAKELTVKDRRGWCEAIEIVGKKTFKLIIDEQAARQNKINSAMNAAKKRDGSMCQITGKKHDKSNKAINITVHHIYSKEHYPHLAACQDNLITLTQEVHNEFHAWNGGSQKPCTVNHLIEFINKLYPDNYKVIYRLNQVKKTLNAQPPEQKAA
ncbi:hypothetical protein [Merismopedia glauca]|uniref:HNH nuclease domain-containing protein n=1 Tax=Merismopedia glauca CCAP 1448/3 TaxID=1296344 RepID=A0A2T1BZJ1_9CYAN|nr:hypothetical protein [Merismopedia glauca]PSB01412.1 hypothetical protein C7B64_18465 [Merismopedia glauca CCAP 1448/3]